MIRQLASDKNTNGIRPLRPARDLGQLADLIENAFGEELSDGGERVLRELRLLSALGPLSELFTGMGSEIDGLFTGFVWEQDGRVVGNVTVNRPTGDPWRWQISNVAVLDAYRGRGIGRQLVEAAINLILARGGHTAYLFVRDNNPTALHLYGSLGFVKVDCTTELKSAPQWAFYPVSELRVLRPLKPRDDEALYELVVKAVGPGHRWLSTVRRRQYVFSGSERFFRWIESLFSAQRETRWGIFAGDRLEAGVILCATRLWNRKPHRLKLWVHPSRRGQVEDALTQDVITLLSREARRPALISLSACEEWAIDALRECGFREIKTLILMKLEL